MRIVFDIGHGTDTKGKGVDNFKEHDFNSAVALKAKELAEKQGFEILFTQQPYSPEIKLGQRCDWVNAEHRKKPIDCLVSFHANASYTNPQATGWGVFYWHNSTKGKRLAELWAKYAEVLPIPKWGTGIWKCEPNTWTNFDIVRRPVMPCILLEHFFFTNQSELEKCNTPEFIQLAAEVTVKALCEYAGKEYREGNLEPTSEERLEALEQAMLGVVLGVPNVAQFLVVQIRLGRITIDDVPERYRVEVEEILNWRRLTNPWLE